jgi:hypothetical protein
MGAILPPPPENFCIFADTSPFLKLRTVIIHIKCTFDDVSLLLEMDPMSHRNIVVDVALYSSASYLEWMTQLKFHTVVQIDDTPVFTVHEVHTKLSSLANTILDSFQLIVAPYKPDAKDQHFTLPQVALDQLRVAHHVLHGWDLADPVMVFMAEKVGTMAKGTHHTRRTCLRGADKENWMEAEFKMLDKNDSYRMYGSPIKRRDLPSTSKSVGPIWNYSQKGNGFYKARKCMDGK